LVLKAVMRYWSRDSIQVDSLTTDLESTLERLNSTQDLLEQAQGDTQAWTVRVQILSLELGG
jgi:hypothetical protein